MQLYIINCLKLTLIVGYIDCQRCDQNKVPAIVKCQKRTLGGRLDS